MRLSRILLSVLIVCAVALAEEDATINAEDGAGQVQPDQDVLIAEESNINHAASGNEDNQPAEGKENYPPVVGYGGYHDVGPVPLVLPVRPNHQLIPNQVIENREGFRPPPPHLKPAFQGNGGHRRPPHDGPRPGYGGEGPHQRPHGRPQGHDRPVYLGGDRPGYGNQQGNGENNGYGDNQGSDPWPLSQPDMPKIVNLDVKCEKNLMKVSVEFDSPFYGIVFSKGHFSHSQCVHLRPGTGRKWANFDISINSCGTTGNSDNGLYGYGANSGGGTYFENTIVIQYDAQVQEIWDQARKLRCTWHDQYEKSVTFRPFPVDMLNVVRADFAGDNVGCWMQIQVGKGPWASEVSGLVKIGQTMTMVLAIKDDDNKFDMLVRNCIAHDGKRAPIQLVDHNGCIKRTKLMSKFTKIKNFGSSATVLSYAHFKAFKFPDSMDVHFQCTIQICRYQCPEQCAGPFEYLGKEAHGEEGYESAPGPNYAPAGRPRVEREAALIKNTEIGVERNIQVISVEDLAFTLNTTNERASQMYKDNIAFVNRKAQNSRFNGADDSERTTDGVICMSTPSFTASLVILLAILITSCLLSTFLYLKYRHTNGRSDNGYDMPPYKKGAKH